MFSLYGKRRHNKQAAAEVHPDFSNQQGGRQPHQPYMDSNQPTYNGQCCQPSYNANYNLPPPNGQQKPKYHNIGRCPPPVQSKWVDLDHPDRPIIRKSRSQNRKGNSVMRSKSSNSVNSQNSIKSNQSSKSEQYKNSVRIPDTKFHSSWTSAESNLSYSTKQSKRTKKRGFKEYVIDVQPSSNIKNTFSDQQSYSESSLLGSTNKSSCSNLSIDREPYTSHNGVYNNNQGSW